MKEKLKNKKVVYTLIGIISLLLVAAAVTYAYWVITKAQTNANTISSGCLDISLSNGSDAISLANQFPITDEDGMELTPYTFTVTNNCNTSVDYQIALEAIGEESTALSSNALKVALNNNARLFSSYKETDTTITGAYEARRLGFSKLSEKGTEGSTAVYNLRVWIDENANISEMNKTFTSKISVTIGQGIISLADSILSTYGGTDGIEELDAETGVFETITTASDAGLYKAQDDLGDSYYFRGAPTNNYVKFGTYAEDTTLTLRNYNYNNWERITVEVKAGTPMYWRIVRINGDGSIRLIYDGTKLVANGTAHTATIKSTAYNENYNDAKYVGYTYDVNGVQVDSTIKDTVDAWYEANLKINYETYIADGIFCNDRSLEKTYNNGEKSFASTDRLSSNKEPVLTCANKEDRYTVSDTTNGNGLLTNPIGLITADEAFLAGGTTDINSTYYLYTSEYYWTFTPKNFGNSYAHVWSVEVGGNMSYDDGVNGIGGGVRPVINLKSDVLFEGKGTIDSPYKIAMK